MEHQVVMVLMFYAVFILTMIHFYVSIAMNASYSNVGFDFECIYFCSQHYVGDLQPAQMEASVQHPTTVCAELDGLVPGVQQVHAEEIA